VFPSHFVAVIAPGLLSQCARIGTHAHRAYAAKGEFKNALLDANKCIDMKADWAKGHSRRGAAYVGLKNWPQAQAAYEQGLELDPSSQVMRDELQKVKSRRQGSGGADARAATAQAQASAGTALGAPATAGPAPVLSLCALLTGALYTVPIMGAARALQCYRMSVGNIILLFVVNLFSTFPKRLSTLSDPKFKASQEFQALFLCIFMLYAPASTPPLPAPSDPLPSQLLSP
jgi:tetratricopeptide (TPR) repeat protein